MAVTQKCSFCGSDIPAGTGKLYVRKDAKLFWLCSNTCEKQLTKLKRKARETPWTAEYRQDKTTRLAAASHATDDVTAAAKSTTKRKKK